MRIQSVTEVSTNLPPNPYILQYSGQLTAGKSASLKSFKDCFISQIQELRAPAMTRDAEGLALSSVWGFYMPQWAPLKPEMKYKARA